MIPDHCLSQAMQPSDKKTTNSSQRGLFNRSNYQKDMSIPHVKRDKRSASKGE